MECNKMISVSLILEYLYCPMKVYMKMQDYDIKTSTNAKTNISREALIGFEELIKRNLWTLKGDMPVKEILEKLLKDVPEFLEKIHQQYKDAAIDDTGAFERLKEDLKFNSWLIAIKLKKCLKLDLLVLKL